MPIEGPHEDDRFWIDRLAEDGAALRRHRPAVRARPLAGRRRHRDGRRADLQRPPLPRPHAGPCRLPPSPNRSSRWSATCCSRARSAAPTFRAAITRHLLDSIVERLWPMGDDTAFVPGHGPMSTFAQSARPIRSWPTGCWRGVLALASLRRFRYRAHSFATIRPPPRDFPDELGEESRQFFCIKFEVSRNGRP